MMGGHRIEPARVPRVTSQESLQRQLHPGQRPVLADSCGCVVGASRMKTAVVARQRAQNQLISFDQNQEDGAHRSRILFQWPARLHRISSLLRAAIPGFAMTTMSAAAIDFWFKRKDSLTSRLTRFLDTALPDDLVEMARPNRGLLPGRGLARTVNSPSVERTGLSNTLSKSVFDRRRCSAPNGPLPAVMTSPEITVDASGRQPRPALGTPTSQDLATAFRGHPCPETVVALATQITRLEGALHDSALRCLYGSRRRTVAPAAKGPKS
jgi:hypothetical protein